MAKHLDPTKLECRAMYGYGTGWFLEETNKRAIAGGPEGAGVDSYCDRCPIREDCWNGHKAKINAEYPVQVAAFKREMDLAASRGVSNEQFAQLAIAAGYPDPHMGAMFENVARGQKDRGAAQGVEDKSTRAERRRRMFRPLQGN